MTVGQRCGLPADATEVAALALVGLADAELVVVADGSAGLPASRAAADAAVRAVARYCRVSGGTPAERLTGALAEGHRAIVDLGRASPSARRLGAACVAALVQSGAAMVARAGNAAAFHTHGPVVTPVFSGSPRVSEGGSGFPSGALGQSDDVPSEIELEVVALEPGDRLVLTTSDVAGRVDRVELGRAAATMEPQVAANRIHDAARRSGATATAVQVVRREAVGLADALLLLNPERQRQLGRWADERREFLRRERQRRLARWGFWILVVAAFVGALASWLAGRRWERTDRAGTAERSGPEQAAVDVRGIEHVLAEAIRERDVVAPSDDVPGLGGEAGPSDAGAGQGGVAGEVGHPSEPKAAAVRVADPPARPPRSEGAPPVVRAAPEAAPARPSPPVPAMGGRNPEEMGPPRPSRAALREVRALAKERVALDAIFGKPTEQAASALRSYILRRHEAVGDDVFELLSAYVRNRPERETVAILVMLLDRRPPPKTRAWLRAILPELAGRGAE